MKTYTVAWPGGERTEIKAENLEEAIIEVNDDAINCYQDGEPYAVAVTIFEGEDEVEDHICYVPAIEPECTHDFYNEHKWAFYSVIGNGGGVITKERCRHCGAYRIADTWYQDSTLGGRLWDKERITYEESDLNRL